MYILKNAYINIIRGKGRNILIGIIITAITISACISLSINKSAKELIQSYKDSNPLEVSFSLNPGELRNSSNEDKSAFTSLTVDDIKKYGDSTLISDYYYTEEVSLSSDDIEPVNYSELEMPDDKPDDAPNNDMREDKFKNMGDYRLTGYSNPSYIEDFINGNKKITDGEMFDKDSTENVIIISDELASQNELQVGSTIKFYNPSDSSSTIEYTVVGIFEDNTNEEETLEILKPIQNLSSFSFTFLIIILIVGGLILSIINIINIRERKYEIGVLRAIGMSKIKVNLQLVAEIFMVSIASLIIGTTIGVFSSQPVTNAMLKNEITNYQEEQNQISQNFGGKDFERPGFNRENKMDAHIGIGNVDYVDTLNVNIDVITVVELFLVSLFLTVISGFISVAFVNKYEPNKILQNRT